MKKIIFIIFFASFHFFAFTQDVITLTDGRIIDCEILSINNQQVRVKIISKNNTIESFIEQGMIGNIYISKRSSQIVISDDLTESNWEKISQKVKAPEMNVDLSRKHDYKFSKITMRSGAVMRPRNITVGGGELTFIKSDPQTDLGIPYRYSLDQIEKIEVAQRSYVVPGLLLGTGVGIASAVIFKLSVDHSGTGTYLPYETWYSRTEVVDQVEQTTYSYDIYGYPTSTSSISYTYNVILRGYVFFGTMIAGVGAGILTGYLIKRGWVTVFPQSSASLKDMDIGFAFYPGKRLSPAFGMRYSF